MRTALLAILLLPVPSLAQSVPADAALQAARVADLAQRLLNPEWLSLREDETPPGTEAFFASAHHAFARATRDALDLSSVTPEGVAALSDPDVARVELAARSFLSPANWTDELAETVLLGAPPTELALADSALVAEFLASTKLFDQLAWINWMAMSHPSSASTESMGAYTREEWIAHLSNSMLWQFITPVRYALREEDPSTISRATLAYSTPTGAATIHATLEGTKAFTPYVHSMLDWVSGLADLDVGEDIPPLPIPGGG